MSSLATVGEFTPEEQSELQAEYKEAQETRLRENSGKVVSRRKDPRTGEIIETTLPEYGGDE